MKSKTNRPIFISFLLLLGAIINLNAQMPDYPKDPQSAEIIITDLENFVQAFEQLKTDTDTLKVLNSMYFEKGSIGLKEFVNRHQLTAELLRDAIRKDPEKYQRIPKFISGMEAIKTQFTQAMLDYDQKIPKAMYAPSYLLVGANRGIAQASQVGQLVTITRILDDSDKLITMMVHELSHFQQAMTMGGPKYVSLYSQPNNMLGLCLREGGAEFLTYLSLGRLTQEKSLAYLREHEVELKKRFEKDLSSQESAFWLWESIDQNEHPKLLGYVMGFQICKSYYDNAEDKTEAIQQILAITNAEEFHQKSRYFSNEISAE